MKKKRALTTLLLGASYQAFWNRYCRANWEQYAARHDADLILFDTPLDDSPRAKRRGVAWQKLLTPVQPQTRDYEQLVWLDADMLIHPRAAWVGTDVPLHLVGATDEYAYPTPDLNRRALAQLYAIWEKNRVPFERNLTPQEFYRVAGFPIEFDRAVQSGMLVLSPRYHRELFAYVYDHYEEATQLKGLREEMRPLSFELLRAQQVHWLDARWCANWLFYQTLHFPFLHPENASLLLTRCITRALSANYFLHFAGAHHQISAVDFDDPCFAAPPRSAPPPSSPAAPCTSPVALFVFNRPDTTAQVLKTIRAVRPRELYVIADGPRAEHADDDALCRAAREVALQIDWDCAVKTNFAEKNLGLKARVESGLDWLFQQVAEAIVLEDDCVPDATFFRFCDELLERYRHDEQVMMISGCDFKFGLSRSTSSYTFSRYPLIWGWATWRRAWARNDPNMSTLPRAMQTNRLRELLGDAHAAQYWAFVLYDNYKTHTTWDYAWLWSIWEHDGLCVHPNINLVANVGFGANATHTRDADNLFSQMLRAPMPFPLTHPPNIARNPDDDALIEEIAFGGTIRRLWQRVRGQRAIHHAQPT